MLKEEHLVLGECATNCFIFYDEESKRAFIVDPGASPARIISKVASLGVAPEAILLTHCHFDHIGAVAEVRKEYGAKVYALSAEKKYLEDSSLNMTMEYTGEPLSVTADVWLADGDTIDLCGHSARIIHTPGHTPGGMCIYIESEDILVTGDTLFCESLGRYDFPGGNVRDELASIIKKLFVLPEKTVVYPGHGESTTIAHEIKYNPVSRFIGKI